MPPVSFTTSGTLRKSALRQANERLVLDALRRNPRISRAEIARTTGFSRPSPQNAESEALQAHFERVVGDRSRNLAALARPAAPVAA